MTKSIQKKPKTKKESVVRSIGRGAATNVIAGGLRRVGVPAPLAGPVAYHTVKGVEHVADKGIDALKGTRAYKKVKELDKKSKQHMDKTSLKHSILHKPK